MLFSRRIVSPASSDAGSSVQSDLEGRRSARESRVRPWLANGQRVEPSGKATGGRMPPASVAKPTVTTASSPATPRSSIPVRPAARLPVAKSRVMPSSRVPLPSAKKVEQHVVKGADEKKHPVSGLPVTKGVARVVVEKKQSSRALAACGGAALVKAPVPVQASRVGRVGTGVSTGSQPPTSAPRRLGSGLPTPGTKTFSVASRSHLPSVKGGVVVAGPGAHLRESPPAARPSGGKLPISSPVKRASASSRNLSSVSSGKDKAGPGVNSGDSTPARHQTAGKLQISPTRASAQKGPSGIHGGSAGISQKVPPQRTRLARSVPTVVKHSPCLPSEMPAKPALKNKAGGVHGSGTDSKASAIVAPRVKHVAFTVARPQVHTVTRWQLPLEERPQGCGCVDRCDNRSAACAGDRVVSSTKAAWLLAQMKMQVKELKMSAPKKAKE